MNDKLNNTGTLIFRMKFEITFFEEQNIFAHLYIADAYTCVIFSCNLLVLIT